MKKYFILIFVVLSMLPTTSCLKKYLDKAPESGLTEDIVFTKYANFKLFFDEAWQSLNNHVSPGHDIEGSWLLVEAAEVLGAEDLLARTRATAVQMAAAVATYLDDDGAIIYEATPRGVANYEKHWWVQAEGLVGFTNAFQLSGRADFAQIADRLWNLIETRFVDRAHGDWFKVLDRNGVPFANYRKTGPWECPYHHSRMCFEMLARLSARVQT